MSKQLLFYTNAVPVSSSKHRDWSVKVGSNYEYARSTNSVPLMAVEFPNAAQEYPVVFAQTDDAVLPVAILGVSDERNMFVDEEGHWKAKYIPAFVRRYPFVFSTTDDGSTLMLCIDESFEGFNQEGVGERLFDAEGERTQYLKSVLSFVEEYQAHFKRTQAFTKRLKELDLFEPMQAKVALETGKQMSLTGFLGINRGKLNTLPGDTLSELAKSGELEMIYIHLQSMKNFSVMIDLATEKQTEPAVTEETVEA
ncbi:SapC family protein [Neptuniibacter halophilus]|uniref:SapC family protein n=1 Tax=Neptuniibacter halophilus TaxID=651666 RepID=UPI002573F500|nr:SapC family protein [Neptuniibacter halophilus]